MSNSVYPSPPSRKLTVRLEPLLLETLNPSELSVTVIPPSESVLKEAWRALICPVMLPASKRMLFVAVPAHVADQLLLP